MGDTERAVTSDGVWTVVDHCVVTTKMEFGDFVKKFLYGGQVNGDIKSDKYIW